MLGIFSTHTHTHVTHKTLNFKYFESFDSNLNMDRSVTIPLHSQGVTIEILKEGSVLPLDVPYFVEVPTTSQLNQGTPPESLGCVTGSRVWGWVSGPGLGR